MFSLCFVATSLILAAGPTRVALMIFASADSIAPRNELSSQGCTTTVDTVGTPFAATIRRSYFDPGALAAAGMTLIGSLQSGLRGLRRMGRGPIVAFHRVRPVTAIH